MSTVNMILVANKYSTVILNLTYCFVEKLVRNVLSNLISDSVGIIDLINPETEQYSVNIENTCTHIKNLTIQSILLEKYGKLPTRVFMALLKEGRAEQQKLSDTTLIPPKELRVILYRFYRDHYVDFFELTRRNDRVSGNVLLYFWSIDEKRVYSMLEESHYQALYNLMTRRDGVGKKQVFLSR